MRVLLARGLFLGGQRYRPDPNGVELPEDTPLPEGTRVWDGKRYVLVPQDQKKREALIRTASRVTIQDEAVNEEDEEDIRYRVYDPRFKSPEAPPMMGGRLPLSALEEDDLDELRNRSSKTTPAEAKATLAQNRVQAEVGPHAGTVSKDMPPSEPKKK